MEEFEIHVSGGQIHCLASGDEGAPLLLYIHGNLACSLWFRQVMHVPGYRTVAPDLPNFGQSYSSGDFSIAGYATILEEFTAALNITAGTPPLIVVGHSLGGVTAMELASRNLLRMEKLVLVAPGPIEGLKTPRERYPVIEAYREDRELLKDAMSRVMPTLNNAERLDELVTAGTKMHHDAFIGHIVELEKADFRERLGRLEYPTLILRGEQDVLITRDMCERTASHLGADYVELSGTGHSPMVENPRQFLQNLENFLN